MTCRNVIKSFGGGLLKGIYCVFGFLEFEKNGIPLEQIVYQLSGQRGSLVMQCTIINLIRYFFLLIPDILFGIMLGKEIYQNFCIGSVYVFSRNANRKKWYRNQIGTIITEAFFFEFATVIVVIGIAEVFCSVDVNRSNIHLLIIYFLMSVLCKVIIAGIFNTVALVRGSSDAFVAVSTMIALGISGLLLLKNGSDNMCFPVRLAIHFNPFAHLILGWKNPVAERIPIFLCDGESILYILFLFITTIEVNSRIVRHKQIFDNNTEEQTV